MTLTFQPTCELRWVEKDVLVKGFIDEVVNKKVLQQKWVENMFKSEGEADDEALYARMLFLNQNPGWTEREEWRDVPLVKGS